MRLPLAIIAPRGQFIIDLNNEGKMKFLLATSLFLIFSCQVYSKTKEERKYFPNMQGCFLLYNIQSQKFEKVIGENNCRERLTAFSTFKVPLSVVALDASLIKDENQIIKWDGKKRERQAWNQDQNLKTWMKESTIWVSQEFTSKLGEKKLKEYLKKLKYGNEDISSGITTAWINHPDDKDSGLTISPYEQVEFMKRLWTNELPVSQTSMKITQEITYLETSLKGFKMYGKTGSQSFKSNQKRKAGWFISRITDGKRDYITVLNFKDEVTPKGSEYGGPRAKALTKKILEESKLW